MLITVESVWCNLIWVEYNESLFLTFSVTQTSGVLQGIEMSIKMLFVKNSKVKIYIKIVNVENVFIYLFNFSITWKNPKLKYKNSEC